MNTHIHFLLGPAGSGKTCRCLDEIRQELLANPAGPPLVMLAPRQATFQLERQLLETPGSAGETGVLGYTRLNILSFERLASWLCTTLNGAPPALLSQEGRVMVLRALLAKKSRDLKLFHASASLPGFAQEISRLLEELQIHGHGPLRLASLAKQVAAQTALSAKLEDLALLMQAYLDWLKEHGILDHGCLLDLAVTSLRAARQGPPAAGLPLGGLWLDGFAELTPQELALLEALAPFTPKISLAFCLDQEPPETLSWLSVWSGIAQAYRKCGNRFDALPGARVSREWLAGNPTRFATCPPLAHLARHWADPSGEPGQARPADSANPGPNPVSQALRVVRCASPEEESAIAAREIIRWVRQGGRYRDCAILLRNFTSSHEIIRRVLTRYEIPFFMDQRESVSHHPLAELTRYALRTTGFGWEAEDWFGALKTGLVPVSEEEVDRLENEALARGWRGAVWQAPLNLRENPGLGQRLEKVRQQAVPAFLQLSQDLGLSPAPAPGGGRPDGSRLARAIKRFWEALRVEDTLQAWSQKTTQEAAGTAPRWRQMAAVHGTVWLQMDRLLEDVAQAFAGVEFEVAEWLAILESGLAGLTVGVIPPALDQVLIGTVDRSRNPDLKLAIVMGANETVFPAPVKHPGLLTESERAALSTQGLELGPDRRAQLGRERFYAYIACTRARNRLVLAFSEKDGAGRLLNPSPFISQNILPLFPGLPIEPASFEMDWVLAEHPCELIVPLLREQQAAGTGPSGVLLNRLSRFIPQLDRLHLEAAAKKETLAPGLPGRLYGSPLSISVTQLETYASCPFKFFIGNALQARERREFQLDGREHGSFLHAVLARFHERLSSQGRRWRDIEPDAARSLIAQIASEEASNGRDGLYSSSAANRFQARSFSLALQEFIGIAVGWMAQYQFNPTAVELAFGLGSEKGSLPAWPVDLGGGHSLLVCGKVDRVDLFQEPAATEARLVVIDYKTGTGKFDPILQKHGIQLQLPAYLCALRRTPEAAAYFKVTQLTPAGAFIVNLTGRFKAQENRAEALDGAGETRLEAYQHTGRFDTDLRPLLDSRPEATGGDQFRYTIKRDGTLGKKGDGLEPQAFAAWLEGAEQVVHTLGRGIFEGVVAARPYQKGSQNACSLCRYQAICRFDPWDDDYHVLKAGSNPVEENS